MVASMVSMAPVEQACFCMVVQICQPLRLSLAEQLWLEVGWLLLELTDRARAHQRTRRFKTAHSQAMMHQIRRLY